MVSLMGKRKRKKKSTRQQRPFRPRKQNFDPDFWENELESRLNEFGVLTCDLPEIDPESCSTGIQYRHAVRVRARYLARQIRAIQQVTKGADADRLFADLMDRAALIDEGPAWFVIEKETRRLRSSSPSAKQERHHQHRCW